MEVEVIPTAIIGPVIRHSANTPISHDQQCPIIVILYLFLGTVYLSRKPLIRLIHSIGSFHRSSNIGESPDDE